ncbi:ABC transporter ATP-binding protein [Georgenia deserti]|uniref:ABC transporter ATP-binding protein n=1 Tax=Georgenia deserti TaxID=2093781 RepID=A0ABW4L4V4_9MICO
MAESELDFEFDPEDLPERHDVGDIGPPSLIVDNVHVKYRVFGAKRAGAVSNGHTSLLNRLRWRLQGNVGQTSEVHAVRGVSFVAHHGESIGIVGTNGSGKSSLLRAAAGLIPPAEGAVYVDNEPSLLGVNAVLMRQLSGERNIMIGGLALGLSAKEVRERFDEIVDFADLGDFVYLPMKTYSSGMAARLRFAISSVATPDILMIDEALATGDADFKQRSNAKIEEIREQAGTIFLVSHSLETVKRMCTRVLWMDHGLLVQDGDPEEVTEAYREHVRKQREGKKNRRKGGARPRGNGRSRNARPDGPDSGGASNARSDGETGATTS